jgi:hypothetical protein
LIFVITAIDVHNIEYTQGSTKFAKANGILKLKTDIDTKIRCTYSQNITDKSLMGIKGFENIRVNWKKRIFDDAPRQVIQFNQNM